jgi:hypothetical protein
MELNPPSRIRRIGHLVTYNATIPSRSSRKLRAQPPGGTFAALWPIDTTNMLTLPGCMWSEVLPGPRTNGRPQIPEP